MLVSGNDFYCGNSTGSLCQFALKSQIPSQYIHPSTKQCNYSIDTSQFVTQNELSGFPTKYSRVCVRRDSSGAIEQTSDEIGVLDFDFSGSRSDTKSFTFKYTSPYPIWFGTVQCSLSGSISGGSCTITGDINGNTLHCSSTFINSSDLSFNGENNFVVSITVAYKGTSYKHGISYNGKIIFTHNYY